MIKPMGNAISDTDRQTLRNLYQRNGAVCLTTILSGFLTGDPESIAFGEALDELTNRHAHDESVTVIGGEPRDISTLKPETQQEGVAKYPPAEDEVETATLTCIRCGGQEAVDMTAYENTVDGWELITKEPETWQHDDRDGCSTVVEVLGPPPCQNFAPGHTAPSELSERVGDLETISEDLPDRTRG